MRISTPRLLLCLLPILAVNHAFAWEKPTHNVEEVIRLAARPEKKVRTLGHEWVWELEQAGIINRRLPGRYRVSLPIAYLGGQDSVLLLSYTSVDESTHHKKVMLLLHFPLD